MKKLVVLTLFGLGIVALLMYRDFLLIYFIELLKLILYTIVAFIILLVGIYIKDRMAYNKLKRDMWKEAP